MKNIAQKGFTLIEVIVAVFMIATVTVSVTALMGRTQKIEGLGKEKLIGISLAREGLELVRVIRDNNWFAGQDNESWVRGICGEVGEQGEFIIDAKSVRQGSGLEVATGANSALYVNEKTNEWSHDPADSVPAQYQFARTLVIDCSSSELGDQNEEEYISVTSRVTWQRAITGESTEQSVSVTEKLYNWLPAQRKVQASPEPNPEPTTEPTPEPTPESVSL